MKTNQFQAMQGTLTKGSIKSHLVKLTMPMIFATFALVAFNLVDTYFVAQLGTNELAAISFTFPAVMTLASLSMGLGVGVSSVIARALGQANDHQVKRLITDSLMLSLLVGGILMLVGPVTIKPLFMTLGARSDVLPLIQNYIEIIYLGFIFLLVFMTANAIIRASGNAMFPGLLMIGATAINLILDPLLIFGWGGLPRLGIQGAALATVISRFTVMVAALIFLYRQQMILFNLPKFKEVFKSWRNILHIAIPSTATNMIKPISMGLIVSMIALYGREAVAGFGIASRLEGFALIVFIALSATVVPVVGQNWGAGKFARVNQTFFLSIQFCLIWGVITAIVLGFASPWLASHFDNNPEVVSVTTAYMIIVPISYAALGIIQISSSTFNAIGRALPPVALMLAQILILYVPLATVGRGLFNLNVIFTIICFSNIIVGLVAFAWNRKTCQVMTGESLKN